MFREKTISWLHNRVASILRSSWEAARHVTWPWKDSVFFCKAVLIIKKNNVILSLLHCAHLYYFDISTVALQPEGALPQLCLLLIPAVQTCHYFLLRTWMCALKDSGIPCGPPFPSSTFMDCTFLFSLFLSPDSGQRDGYCVMSVIVLILLFSQHFNLFMLLPNLYWAIICILYMIAFPLPVIWQLWGLHSHVGLCKTCCCCSDSNFYITTWLQDLYGEPKLTSKRASSRCSLFTFIVCSIHWHNLDF